MAIGFDKMLWLAGQILHGLRFLTPVAFFPPLEVIVLTFGALPATIGKLEVTLLSF